VSEWRTIEQSRIDEFAHATDDPQWIHTDPEAAAAGPFGTTIAHGFLTLSMLPQWTFALMHVEDASAAINYGLNKVRFPAPVPSGSRVRGTFRVVDIERADWGHQATMAATIERDGGDKPVCVAELVFRYYKD
jgi:acyl dehydratase